MKTRQTFSNFLQTVYAIRNFLIRPKDIQKRLSTEYQKLK